MKRDPCRPPARQVEFRTPFALFMLRVVTFALVCSSAAAFANQSRQQPGAGLSPQQALAAALSAACRQDTQGFSRYLLAGSSRALLALPPAEQKDFLRRFSLTTMPGNPRTLLDAQKRLVVQCNTPADTQSFGLNAAQVDGNVAFIPVALGGGETTTVGMVRQPEGWKVFSLDLLVVSVPALIEQWQQAEMRANEQQAAADLLSIAEAIKSYHSSFGAWPDTLDQLGPAPPNAVSPEHAQLLPTEVASGLASGYRFRYRVVTDTHGAVEGFELGAVPEVYGKTGRQSFFLDENGKIHAADKQGAPATADDPVISPPPEPSS